ncbi:MAG: ATP-binding protein [Pseudomonadota bacterium]
MARAMLASEQLQGHQDERVATRAGKICAAIDRVAEICRRELEPKRCLGNPQELGPSCVEGLLRDVANVVAAECTLAQEPIHFFIFVEDDVRLRTDLQSLFRIVFNLALNAANALATRSGSRIELSAFRPRGNICINVSDDGPGLPEHVLDYLYPRIGGAPATRNGRIGSGLITAAALASDLAGQLILTRSTDAGTSFRLLLPEPIEGARFPKARREVQFVPAI